jgi:catechol 2,3-dioxygenase-like lactoylglutathione lyase family enzyme
MVRKFMFGILPVVFSALTMLSGCENSIAKPEKGVVASVPGQTKKKAAIRLEHVALNVEDPVKMAEWYCRNLQMKVVRKGPAPVNAHFICDAGANMMLEIYHNPPDAVPDYAAMDPLLLHVAFMVDDVKGVREKLIAAGATPVGEVSTTLSGDEIAMLRDPWGLAIQFVKRAEPMLLDK